jgi:hypothetical protein
LRYIQNDSYEPVTSHPSCDGSKGKRQLCPACLYWDPRPEEGSGPGVGYCEKRDVVTRIRCECNLFEEATPTRVEARNRSIYGTIPDESEESEE